MDPYQTGIDLSVKEKVGTKDLDLEKPENAEKKGESGRTKGESDAVMGG